MLRGFLIDEADGRRVPVKDTLVVGRTRDCGLAIDDSAASRRHMEISSRPDRFVWRDLGSTNGTMLNGARMLAGELKHDDEIQIGETVLRFEVEELPDPPEAMERTSLFRETIVDVSGEMVRQPDADNSTALLEAVYKVINDIAANYDSCKLIDKILETTIQAINAQRGAVFLADENDELQPCPICGNVHCIRDGVLRPADHDEIRISRTVAKRVLRDGESVHYRDTDSDSELNAAESIMSLDLRSILCGPLRAKKGILGILYVDSNRPDQSYSHEDMLLVSAVGNSAGLALENAQMHQEMLEKQRIEQEIATAWTIQEGFLVKEWPENEERFQVYGETRPAKTVGGDFYDFVQPEEHVAGILIGDVSGKGVPASLAMAQLLAQFRLHARDQESPAEVLRQLNAELSKRSQRGLFCTLCYIRLDLTTGIAVCANAGHSSALRIGEGGVSSFGEATGPPAGILPDGPWSDETVQVNPGDALLLYTDGIIEARSMATQHDSAHELPDEYEVVGLVRLTETLCGAAPEKLIESVNRDVQRFCAPMAPHDDCTMVALRYLGNAG